MQAYDKNTGQLYNMYFPRKHSPIHHMQIQLSLELPVARCSQKLKYWAGEKEVGKAC